VQGSCFGSQRCHVSDVQRSLRLILQSFNPSQQLWKLTWLRQRIYARPVGIAKEKEG
jgi:hypothetical protein